ncbi:MAG: DUF3570 domain-containing protein [Spirosomataceae bacterium]
MRKITLAIGLVASLLTNGYSQKKPSATNTNYETRPLTIDEVNLVTSYYSQDGNNSAVTGGKGTEKLWDWANSIDIKLSAVDKRKRQHSFSLDFNIDHYSSASSDKIDPLTISSASMKDTHIYPSLSWNVKNAEKRTSWGVALNYSTEYDYKSYGLNANFSKLSKDNNREFMIKASAFFDTWTAILPAELRPVTYGSGARDDMEGVQKKPRNSYSMALSLSQILTQRFQVLVMVEPSFQNGLLSTPYHRVYFSNGTESVERLPGTRFKLPIGLRGSYFIGDNFILRGFYRFYLDDWGMKAHTFSFEIPYKITPFVSLSPFYRFNTQTAVRYFNPYGQNVATSTYHTSDYDISALSTHYVGAGLRLAPPDGVFGMQHWNNVEIRFGHYYRTNGLVANSITLLAKLK